MIAAHAIGLRTYLRLSQFRPAFGSPKWNGLSANNLSAPRPSPFSGARGPGAVTDLCVGSTAPAAVSVSFHSSTTTDERSCDLGAR